MTERKKPKRETKYVVVKDREEIYIKGVTCSISEIKR